MKLINSSYEIIEPKSYDLDSVFKHIELCGRVCYHSYDKITPDSSTKFVDRMIKSGHTSVLEHGTIYLYREFDNDKLVDQNYNSWCSNYINDPYSVINMLYKQNITEVYVTTNYRVIIENALQDDLQYMVNKPMIGHECRYTVRFICDRGVSHEFVRHRHFSFSQESQRYCNYSKDKFDNEITFISPSWSLAPMVSEDFRGQHFLDALENAENEYLYLVENGWTPQQARGVLPNATKTELIMTGFVSDWQHFFDLRDDSRAHPDAQKLAKPLHEEFIKRGWTYGKQSEEI